MKRLTATLSYLLCLAAYGQRDLKLDDIPDASPDAEMATFQLADGFEVNLFASDPAIAKPIQMNWDAEGRLWVVSSRLYPHIKPGQRSDDQIIVLEDADGDGVAEKSTVFAEDLLIPTGLLPADGGVYVANSTELLFLKDTTGDGKADFRQVMLSGFGTEDTHHLLHTLRGGPDGMIYMNQSIYIHSHVETPWGPRRLMGGGIWHFRPQTRELEVFCEGFVNPWGHVFDRWGQSFATDGAYGEGVNYVFPGSVFVTAPGAKRTMKGMSPGQPKHCSLELLSGRHLPEQWRGVMLANDFRGHRVNAFRISEDGAGYAARQIEDLIKTTHAAFRPIDVRVGPDGAIYIADWYNPIIQHGEVDFRDPRRDHVHGRIWRITAKGRPLVKRPQIVGAEVGALLEMLRSEEDMTRYFAKRELLGRDAAEVVPALEAWAAQEQRTTHELLEALWAFQGRNVLQEELLRKLLAAPEPQARAAAVRVVYHWHKRLPDHLEILATAIADEHPQVRLEAVNALRRVGSARATELAMRALEQPVDANLDFALWRTARDLQSVWLPAFQKGEINFGGVSEQLSFALRSAENAEALAPLLVSLEKGETAGEDADAVIALIGEFGSPKDLGRLFAILARTDSAARQSTILRALSAAARVRQLVPEGDLSGVERLFEASDEALASLALRAAGMWRLQALRQKLEAAAVDGAPGRRLAAVDALASLGGEASQQFLKNLSVREDVDLSLRAQAAAGLVAIDPGLAASRSAELLGLAQSDQLDATRAIYQAFLTRKGGPAQLANALGGKKLDPDVALLGVQQASSSGGKTAPLIAALTKAGSLQPVTRALDDSEMAAMMDEVAQRGDAARGEVIYSRATLLCATCHAIGGAGGVIGPDMVSIGASAPVDYIIESLLEPSKKIKEGYHTTQVTKKNGDVLTGGLLSEGAGTLVLRSPAGEEISIPSDQIAGRTVSPVSLMPPGLTASLRRDEFIDLVKFLSELGKEGDYKVPREPYVRRWRVSAADGSVGTLLRRSGVNPAMLASERIVWTPAYSRVSGELPLDSLPISRGFQSEISIVRFEVKVAGDGEFKLRLNDTNGLQVWVDDATLDFGSSQASVSASAGVRKITVVIDRKVRRRGLTIEVLDGSARATPLGGL
ncbi:MAG: PVC-type heme-binding CxxCH protein [Verrucomicrobiales bacterium]